MKKNLLTVVLAVVVLSGATIYVATPEQPERYVIHTVQYGETMESIVQDSNKNTSVNYDIRDAIATAVAESSKIDGGATSRSIKPGEKVAVPIYRR